MPEPDNLEDVNFTPGWADGEMNKSNFLDDLMTDDNSLMSTINLNDLRTSDRENEELDNLPQDKEVTPSQSPHHEVTPSESAQCDNPSQTSSEVSSSLVNKPYNMHKFKYDDTMYPDYAMDDIFSKKLSCQSLEFLIEMREVMKKRIKNLHVCIYKRQQSELKGKKRSSTSPAGSEENKKMKKYEKAFPDSTITDSSNNSDVANSDPQHSSNPSAPLTLEESHKILASAQNVLNKQEERRRKRDTRNQIKMAKKMTEINMQRSQTIINAELKKSRSRQALLNSQIELQKSEEILDEEVRKSIERQAVQKGSTTDKEMQSSKKVLLKKAVPEVRKEHSEKSNENATTPLDEKNKKKILKHQKSEALKSKIKKLPSMEVDNSDSYVEDDEGDTNSSDECDELDDIDLEEAELTFEKQLL